MEEKDLFDGTVPMERLKQKAKLISDTIRVFSGISKYEKVLPRRFRKKAVTSLQSDFIKGLKQINKKIPVYIELPKLESCGNGMYKEVDPKTKEPVNNEIHTTPCQSQLVASDTPKILDYTQ